MKRITIATAAIAALSACIITGNARAQPINVPAPSIVGLHLHSAHIQQPTHSRFNDDTTGMYAMWANGVTVGAFRNSMRMQSVYAGWTWQGEYAAITFGGITGYPEARVLPLVIPSIRLPLSQHTAARVSFAANPAQMAYSAFTLSIEYKF